MSTTPSYDDDYYYEYYEYNNTYPNDIFVFYLQSLNMFNIILGVVSIIICLLGICGNGLVIWITGFKMKRTVNTTWYLSLAISDFLFCVCLIFSITQTFNWNFGVFLCKLIYFGFFLNMYSSIFLLVIISVDRVVVVVLAVWAQNNRTLKRASLTVVCAWVIAMALSVPSAVFRNAIKDDKKSICNNNYSTNIHIGLSVSRFTVCFVMPLVIITVCYIVIIERLRSNRMARSTKPFKVMTAVIATFTICCLPYHVFTLLNIHFYYYKFIAIGLKISMPVFSANSFLNPFLYAFMGRDFKATFWSSFVSKIEKALEEEGQLDDCKKTSVSNANVTTV